MEYRDLAGTLISAARRVLGEQRRGKTVAGPALEIEPVTEVGGAKNGVELLPQIVLMVDCPNVRVHRPKRTPLGVGRGEACVGIKTPGDEALEIAIPVTVVIVAEVEKVRQPEGIQQ